MSLNAIVRARTQLPAFSVPRARVGRYLRPGTRLVNARGVYFVRFTLSRSVLAAVRAYYREDAYDARNVATDRIIRALRGIAIEFRCIDNY